MNTETTETPVTEARPEVKSWTPDTTNPPGPIQINKFNKAWRGFAHEHSTHVEKWGVIGGEEHESTLLSLCGGGYRQDVAQAQHEIGVAYDWKLSRANIGEVTDKINAALVPLKLTRPVTDKRKTKEQAEAEDAELAKAKAEREALETSFARTVPEFQATIHRLAKVTQKAHIAIYGWWREYAESCTASDQSPVMGEFIQWYALQLDRSPEVLQAAIAQPAFKPLGTVRYNREHDGVEIAFDEKPNDELRYRLQRAKFRITRRPPWRWYQRYNAQAWDKAVELAGVNPAENPRPTLNTDPAAAYVQAQEDAALDAQCAAIGA